MAKYLLVLIKGIIKLLYIPAVITVISKTFSFCIPAHLIQSGKRKHLYEAVLLVKAQRAGSSCLVLCQAFTAVCSCCDRVAGGDSSLQKGQEVSFNGDNTYARNRCQ